MHQKTRGARIKLIAISDLHGHTSNLNTIARELSRADLVLISGDITHFGGSGEAAHALDAVRIVNKNILAVPGNCDMPGVGEYLSQQGYNLSGNILVRSGIAFAGIEGSLPCPGKTPNEFTEAQYESLLNKLRGQIPKDHPLVFLSHQPPRARLIDKAYGRNVGSTAIRTFLSEAGPTACFCGHIHEARGVEKIDNTLVANPGPIREGHYTYAEIGTGAERIEIRSLSQH